MDILLDRDPTGEKRLTSWPVLASRIAVGPGQRPLSSMTPTHAERITRWQLGRNALARQAAARIIPWVAIGKSACEAIEARQDVGKAGVSRRRFHHQVICPNHIQLQAAAFSEALAGRTLEGTGATAFKPWAVLTVILHGLHWNSRTCDIHRPPVDPRPSVVRGRRWCAASGRAENHARACRYTSD